MIRFVFRKFPISCNFVRLAVFQIQLSSFTVFVPLVFTTTGGMAPEAKHFIRRIAVLTATKTNEDYSQVMCNIRTHLILDIVRSVLAKWKAKKAWTAPISNVSFNLIPEEKSYECQG